MSLSLLSSTKVFGPNDTLKKLSDEHLGLKIVVLNRNTNEAQRVFLTFDEYERFTKEHIDVDYGVVFVVDSDKGFPIDEQTKLDFDFVNRIVPMFGDTLFDYLYRCDGKWASLLCDNEGCCPALGKPVDSNTIHFMEIVEGLGNSASVSE